MAAPVHDALAVVEVLRAALAAQLVALDPSAEQQELAALAHRLSLSLVLCSVAFSSRRSLCLPPPLCCSSHSLTVPRPPPQDDSLSPPAKRGRAVVTKPVEVVELSDDDEDEVRATVRSARGTQSTQATQPKTRAPPSPNPAHVIAGGAPQDASCSAASLLR